MRFLITGGAGFIGSHLSDRLLAEGHRVLILDNLSTGRLENVPPQAQFVQGDVADFALVLELMNQADGCFHLAAVPSVFRAHQDWLGCSRVNFMGSITVFDAAKHLLPKKKIPIVYASSAAVYGNLEPPLRETMGSIPLSAYGVDKLATELHANIATLVHGIPTVGLRFFNVFGPRQDPLSPYSGVISIFTEKIRNRLPVSIYGDGEQVRDFVYIEDVVTALIRAFDSCKNGVLPRVYNICTGKKSSILALAKEVANFIQHPLQLRFLPERLGDIRTSLGDPKRAAQELGFKAQFNLTQGLSKMVLGT